MNAFKTCKKKKPVKVTDVENKNGYEGHQGGERDKLGDGIDIQVLLHTKYIIITDCRPQGTLFNSL